MTPSEKRYNESKVATWNRLYAPGSSVIVRRDSGQLQLTLTRSDAFVDLNGNAMVYLRAISGCYRLDRVTPTAEVRVIAGEGVDLRSVVHQPQ